MTPPNGYRLLASDERIKETDMLSFISFSNVESFQVNYKVSELLTDNTILFARATYLTISLKFLYQLFAKRQIISGCTDHQYWILQPEDKISIYDFIFYRKGLYSMTDWPHKIGSLRSELYGDTKEYYRKCIIPVNSKFLKAE